MKDAEKKYLKEGVKVIAITDSSELAVKKNNVYTFSNWYTPEVATQKNDFYKQHPQFLEFLNKGVYFQVQELKVSGNDIHNFDCSHFEIYNPKIHTEAIIVTPDMYLGMLDNFKKKFIRYRF